MVDLGPLSPWQPSCMTDPSDWLVAAPVAISALVNPINGETVRCPPGTQIMSDDLDWMVDGWQAVFLIEWKIRQAELTASMEPAAPSH